MSLSKLQHTALKTLRCCLNLGTFLLLLAKPYWDPALPRVELHWCVFILFFRELQKSGVAVKSKPTHLTYLILKNYRKWRLFTKNFSTFFSLTYINQTFLNAYDDTDLTSITLVCAGFTGLLQISPDLKWWITVDRKCLQNAQPFPGLFQSVWPRFHQVVRYGSVQFSTDPISKDWSCLRCDALRGGWRVKIHFSSLYVQNCVRPFQTMLPSLLRYFVPPVRWRCC